MTPRERAFADAERVVNESVAMSIVKTALEFAGRPFEWRQLPTLKGWACVVAIVGGIITHAILLQFLPARLSPVKPMAYWMVVAFGAFVAGVGFHATRSSSTAIADSNAGTAKTRKS